ncbi:T9SS type A sorting domain-containing protein [Aquimarina sp. 2201CG5-10]|uniref:T9SS type A sorting domain-containing protein n=1 Tax=Aquimarina callyspongiae TaxID=3098150 RepID=UPI002AB50441|nr:T9SS type A sorting domain-containing protein [Aquimarina sp. 2201CG5-10]MDY8136444.1 T9SS type A sorting domain-containing protein [Aquimarina sp. 2201CG5-10]
MKKIIFILIVLVSYAGISQYNENAPWMQNLLTQRKSSNNNNPIKYQEIVDAFDNYWKNKDHTKKGSGYKPFMRWATYWKDFVKEDGTLPTPQEMQDVWNQKRAMQSNLADDSNWQSLGPYVHTNTGSWSSGQGRVNAIIIDPNNSNTYYVGTPAGGIWKSTDAGVTWAPLSDDLLQIGVSAIAIHPTDPNIIYIGTGDDDASDTYSIGVLKSTDGGATWNSTGLTFNNSSSLINEIYLDPSDSNKIFVSSNTGFYKSTDAGVNFARTLNQDLDDMKLKPGNSNIIYAATNSRVYKSTDNGDSFQLSSTGLPSTGGRIALAVTANAASNVYVLSTTTGFAFQGVFRSTDDGATFTRLDNASTDLFNGSTQGWYDLGFEVSDTDQNIIYVGTVDIYRSTNGGTSFSKWNSWNAPASATYTHADIHMIREFNGVMFFGTDGGIYRLNGSSTEDLTEGLAIGQFYRLSVSSQSSANMVGGLQDNGGYAYSGNNWKNYYGADGMDTAVDPTNPNKYYGFIQNGGGLYFSNDAGASLAGSINGPENGNWITPLAMNKEGELFAGYSRFYKLVGSSFQAVSPSFISRLRGIEIDPTNSDIIYVFFDNRLYRSADRGVTFEAKNIFTDGNITSVAVSSTNNSVVYVTTSSNVHKSTDDGTSFASISSNLPNDTKLIVKHQGLHPDNPIYVGTSLGVYRLDDTSTDWEPFLNNLPNVAVRDLEINVTDGNITAATYGRGVWRSDMPLQAAQNEAGLISADIGGSLACGTITPKVTVSNLGLNAITSFDINYSLDGGAAVAQSWSGNLANGNTVEVTLSQVDPGALGNHNIEFEIIMPNDAFPANNKQFISFDKNNNAPITVNDFETTNDVLLTGGSTLWERGAPSGTILNAAASGQNVYGTNLAGTYPNNAVSYLISGCYDLTSLQDPILKFDMAFDLETDWDFMNVEYSTNNGQSWSILGAATDPNWYNSDRLPNGTDCTNCPGAQWTGTDGTFKEYSYDLAALTNESSFIFRFNFVSDGAVQQEGVVIDNLVIEGTFLSVDDFTNRPGFTLFPNPSKDIFTIQWRNASEASYEVYDVSGKMIASKNNIESSDRQIQLDMSSYSKGMYFIKVSLDKNEITQKLIRN